MKVQLSFSLLIGLASLGPSQDPATSQTKTYENSAIGFSIRYPSEWQATEKSDEAWFRIPLKEGAGVAALHIVATRFNADSDIWQKSQENINKQMGLEVVRQWKEEILGVPLLLTSVRGGPGKMAAAIKAVPGLPGDQPLLTLVGLVYSASNQKMLFRLTAPESHFSEAELAFRKTLESLRTSNGQLPTPEDPTRKPEVIPTAGPSGELPPTRTPIGTAPAPSAGTKTERAPKVYETEGAARKVGFYYPEGWTVEAKEDGSTVLKHDATGFTLGLAIRSTLDSEPPMRALLRASSESLRNFDEVVSRDESKPRKNAAGAMVTRIWRTGKNANGPLVSLEGVGSLGANYFLIRWSGEGALDPERVKLVQSLLDRASVEPIG